MTGSRSQKEAGEKRAGWARGSLMWLDSAGDGEQPPGWALQWAHVHGEEAAVAPEVPHTVAPEHILIWARSHVVNTELLIRWSCF